MKRWHPGQDWIWDAGNFGVFDPGINALSILTKIAPAPMFVKSAKLLYPENRDTPIAAALAFRCRRRSDAGAALSAEFDWRQEGEQSWNIDIETEAGAKLRLTHGGSRLFGRRRADRRGADAGIRRHLRAFRRAARRKRERDGRAPFQLVGDAFLVGSRRTVAPFHW